MIVDEAPPDDAFIPDDGGPLWRLAGLLIMAVSSIGVGWLALQLLQ
ncbi:hypothetical protein [Fulvimarina manganoxydans]|nr:hypothetical protein [Fulvimarina manganoxydans]